MMNPRRYYPKRKDDEAFDQDNLRDEYDSDRENNPPKKAQKAAEIKSGSGTVTQTDEKRRAKNGEKAETGSAPILMAHDTTAAQAHDTHLHTTPLNSMPDELLCEIFGQAMPLDLLRLAQTSKKFRSILMHTSARRIWERARLGLPVPGLPDCPPDLNEVQYATLIFAPYCQLCLKEQANSGDPKIITDVYARIKACMSCLRNKKLFLAWKRRKGLWWNGPYPQKMAQYLPYVSAAKGTYNPKVPYNLFYHPANDAWAREYEDAESKEKWVEDKTRIRRLAQEHSVWCKVFIVEWNKHLVKERKAIIADYVKSLGWEEEFSKNSDEKLLIQNDPSLQKDLEFGITQQWLDNTRDWFNYRMNEIKIERLDRARRRRVNKAYPILRDVLENFALDLPPNALVPRVPDIIGYPVIQEIIHGNEVNENLTAKDFEPLRSLFPEIVAQSIKEREEKLLTLIAEELGENSFDPKMVLHLATTIFHCESCDASCGEGLLRYPRVLIHKHAYECPNPGRKRFGDEHSDKMILTKDFNHFSWGKTGNISFRKEDVNTLSDALTTLGYDPKITTTAEIEAADPIVKCEGCVVTGWYHEMYQCVMRWSWVALHGERSSKRYTPAFCNRNSKSQDPVILQKVDEKTAQTARSKMLEATNKYSPAHEVNTNGFFMCSRCRVWGDMESLSIHLRDVHNVDCPTEGDIVVRLDADVPQTCILPIEFEESLKICPVELAKMWINNL
ncbi:hypothetical protein JR316_0006535 [Psilocybe cubensis]|uniref:Uncharacterized protein n=2 Tax=Psilocybe cubensis TaxID=181762 RepID=A0ACB8H1X3_PSICU|nr:hypothetical protein JR316_0006535 [Psilocybe cubensis]KAH9482005.1 hypothetical protein JR316_0006535 [Psilocybe cubensis]